MIGYYFAFGALVVLLLAFFLFRSFGKSSSKEEHADYKKGTTYEKPQAEEVTPPGTQHDTPGVGGTEKPPR